MHKENRIILEVLQREGFTQAFVYNRMGLKQGSWQRRMGSSKPPTTAFLKEISEITGLTIDDLRGAKLLPLIAINEDPDSPNYFLPEGRASTIDELSDREFMLWVYDQLSAKIKVLSEKTDTLEGLLRSVLSRLSDKAK